MPRPELAIIDTSIYVSVLRQGRFLDELRRLPMLVRFSAVVIAELLRGARSRQAREQVHDLYKSRPLVTPDAAAWTESGDVLAILAKNRNYDAHTRREVHFDALIALSARDIGAHVITCNADDFEAIRAVRDFKLVVWR